MNGSRSPLRVAIVGSGPAGSYAAAHLMNRREFAVQVEMFDRLPTPWGLVRSGVAPDHAETKMVVDLFERTAGQPGFRFHLNVEIGKHLGHQDVLDHHHAVIYAVGAPDDRELAIPGKDLPGSHGAAQFVAWYNGHPEHRDLTYDLSGKRAVVIGNGNVALDVARILTKSTRDLAETDIADHALAALAENQIEEVVVLGRRGPAQAAFTTPELLALAHPPDVDVVVDPTEVALADEAPSTFSARMKAQILQEYAARAPRGRRRRIVLRFLATPVEIVGTEGVEGVRVARSELVSGPDGSLGVRTSDDTELLEAGLVLRSIGSRGRPFPGLPFDERRGTIANDEGRVIEPGTGRPLPGAYTTGWIKRGPSGVIGTNKKCAGQTVEMLLADHAAGLLPEPSHDAQALERLIRVRQPDVVDHQGWRAIDSHERERGEAEARPRVKLVRVDHMLRVAGSDIPA